MKWEEDRDARPAKSGKYLVYKMSNEFDVLHFSVKHQAWNLHDRVDNDRTQEIKVLFWAKLPNPFDIGVTDGD